MNPSPLVSVHWLADHLNEADLRVFDATVHLDPTPRGLEARSGRAEYDAKHMPGAGFLDILAELSDAGSELRFTRPPPEVLAGALARAGISQDDRAGV